MNIVRIAISKLRIPLIRPFITALRRTDFIEDIVVTLECSNGLIGFGSAAATPAITGDTQESILGAIQIMGRWLLGKSIEPFEELLFQLQSRLINNPSAKAAIDIALHDLMAQHRKMPLYQFLGGCCRNLTIVNTISVKSAAEMVEDAELFVEQGFATLKIKVGLDQSDDIERIQAIHAAIGDKAQLICDANQGWDSKSALRILEKLHQNNVDILMIEQPVKAWDYAGLKYIRDHSAIPIYADESVFNLRDAAKIATEQIADGINIKLMKSGGLYQAQSIYQLANAYQIPCMAGCMLESPIGLTAMASFVIGRSQIRFIDLDPIAMIRSNPVIGGIQLKGASLTLSEAPGLGIQNVEHLEPLATLE
ncbi:MAG: hypothetical protein A3F10_07665 [Coxiella sp. RIFCSPHIGHO2_12_FULL_42_15]|nr:MAG: hypothetical protein A3F10_07665 [Coxiella sp. RIFCSPHIGHO2_12_FULL_42_15]